MTASISARQPFAILVASYSRLAAVCGTSFRKIDIVFHKFELLIASRKDSAEVSGNGGILDVSTHDREITLDSVEPCNSRQQSPALKAEPIE
jgi:hypothetical protein